MVIRSSPRRRRSAPISRTNFQLNVPIGTAYRGVYLKWLFFGPSCIEPAMTDRAFPRKEEARRGMLGYGDFDTVMDVVAKAVANGPYLMGDKFTVADAYLFTILRWTTRIEMDLAKWPNLKAYADRVAARPKVQEALKAEGLIK